MKEKLLKTAINFGLLEVIIFDIIFVSLAMVSRGLHPIPVNKYAQ